MPESAPVFQVTEVDLPDGGYPVFVGPGLLNHAEPWSRHLGNGLAVAVTNDTVGPLYLSALRAALGGRRIAEHVIPDGEQHKTQESWAAILDTLVSLGARRDAVVIALGGGVVGDLAGFAAASYMRGIRFVQIPTTLLAQVDASVGGKTGFNHPRGKNLVGAFHQPAAVIIDTETLHTLPQREFRAGLAEVVKYGAIMDEDFLAWLEVNCEAIAARESGPLAHLIQRCVECKARVVAADEKESGQRAILNFGHTFAHAIESLTEYRRFLHGEAVSIGMVAAAWLSELRGLATPGTAERLRALLHRFELPVDVPEELDDRSIIDAMGLDKKAVSAGLRLVLLAPLAHAVVDDRSTRQEIVNALEAARERRASTA